MNMSVKFRKRREHRPSLRRKLFLALGSIAAILLLSSIISIYEYRRMSDYVSEIIESNIRSIDISQSLADLVHEYNYKMIDVVVRDDISLMPELDKKVFTTMTDSLRSTLTSEVILPYVDTLDSSIESFIDTFLHFDEVFLSDSIDTREWFFVTLQPCYDCLRDDIEHITSQIHEELIVNSNDFDAGFYRSIMPGVVAVGAGLMLVMLLLFFMMTYYVKPIYRIVEGLQAYRASGRRHGYEFEGDDQLSEINNAVTELIDENIQLKKRVRKFREEREMNLQR